MMTHQLEVSILAAPLAAMDRRVLSQAWYSALRLAPRAQKMSEVRARILTPPAARIPSGSRGTSETTRGSQGQRRHAQALLGKPGAGGDNEPTSVSRERKQRSPLAERIERAFSDPRCYPKRITFSMGRGGARVHIILQIKGEQTTLLALCRPELRGVVGPALERARLALAARGIGVEMLAAGDRRCSSIQV
jgi:hypothetical protein